MKNLITSRQESIVSKNHLIKPLLKVLFCIFTLIISVPVLSQSAPTEGSAISPVEVTTPAQAFETCFSPNEACDLKLISFIQKATISLDIAIYSITHQAIVDSILAAKNKGLKIRMVVDRTQSKGRGSLVSSLIASGIELKIGNFSGIMHDKYTIVDGKYLETGSFNYTENATSKNGENQIYLTEFTVVQQYTKNFENLWVDGLAPGAAATTPQPPGGSQPAPAPVTPPPPVTN